MAERARRRGRPSTPQGRPSPSPLRLRRSGSSPIAGSQPLDRDHDERQASDQRTEKAGDRATKEESAAQIALLMTGVGGGHDGRVGRVSDQETPAERNCYASPPVAAVATSDGSVGSCFNAMIESFWSRMQVELLDRRHWRTRVELANAILETLEIFHNHPRRHSALGMLTPIESETRHQSATVGCHPAARLNETQGGSPSPPKSVPFKEFGCRVARLDTLVQAVSARDEDIAVDQDGCGEVHSCRGHRPGRTERAGPRVEQLGRRKGVRTAR
jgi:Integrase core domain